MNHAMKKVDTLKVNLGGMFRVVLNQGTDREVDSGFFHNLITDYGLNQLGLTSDGTLHTQCCVGTGTTTPANSNTSIQAFVANSSDRTIDEDTNDGASAYSSHVLFHWTFAQGAVVGNMAEVTIGKATDGTNIWSRARILDGAGSPTTLTCTSLDQLTVYYKLTVAPVLTDVSSSVTLSGTAYPYTVRLSDAASFASSPRSMLANEMPMVVADVSVYPSTSALGAITSEPTGSPLSCTTTRVGTTYAADSKYYETTITFGPASGNITGGIGAMKIRFASGFLLFQYVFSTPIPKDNTKTLVIVTRIAWDRA